MDTTQQFDLGIKKTAINPPKHLIFCIKLAIFDTFILALKDLILNIYNNFYHYI